MNKKHKKIWYSQPLSIQWESYYKNYKKNNENILDFFKRKNKSIVTNTFLSPQKRQIEAFILDLWATDANKRLLHLYFVDKLLRDFLANIKIPDLNGIIDFIKENSFSSNPKFLLPNGKPINISSEKTNHFSFGIHIPYENKYRGYAFNIMLNNNEMVLIWSIGKSQGWCPLKYYNEFIKSDSNEDKEMIKIIQLAINTIAYMNTFPDCIIDGVPNIIKEQSYSKDNSLIIDISEKVLYSSHDNKNSLMISPHFRRGHFRRLTSDYYTKMKGQIIFVHETMVNGKAKTVYTSDEFQIMEENTST